MIDPIHSCKAEASFGRLFSWEAHRTLINPKPLTPGPSPPEGGEKGGPLAAGGTRGTRLGCLHWRVERCRRLAVNCMNWSLACWMKSGVR